MALHVRQAAQRHDPSELQILDEVWGEGWVGDDHIVDVHVAQLRHKLGDDSRTPRFVRTVRGVGYRMGLG
jgi:DNA-binding response OmpR family regulator